ncbi:MAG: hypothetical protein AB1Y25_06515 [Cycloclasticus sp.]
MLELLPMLSLGLGLGLLHALDADHVMAMSVLSSEKPGLGQGLFFSGFWALGHGSMIILITAVLFSFGWVVPQQLIGMAETAVGLLLVGLGLKLFFNFKGKSIQLEQHSHGDIVHSHWHNTKHLHNPAGNLSGAHKPVLIGLLHGFAGSAPAIALIPALAYAEINMVALYLLTFSIGVMLAMMGFGLGFSYCQGVLMERYQVIAKYQAKLVALTSVSVGCFWLSQAV